MRVLEGRGGSGAWRRAREVHIGPDGGSASAFRVRGVRGGGKFAILALEDIGDLSAAEGFRGQKVFIMRDLLPPLEEGTYYVADLIGLRVEDRRGRNLGTLHEIFDNGAHEVYAVRHGMREILLPVIDSVVISVDIEAGRMVVVPPAGLPGIPTRTE